MPFPTIKGKLALKRSINKIRSHILLDKRSKKEHAEKLELKRITRIQCHLQVVVVEGTHLLPYRIMVQAWSISTSSVYSCYGPN